MARRNTKKTARGGATLAALAVLLVAAPSLAEDSGIRAEASPCQQVERVVGASCPIRAAAEPTEEADGQVARVAMGDIEIPIYVPPSRGDTASRVSGSVRGLERPGNRL